MPRFLVGTTRRLQATLVLTALLAGGCGTLKSQSATEQLLMSDAVDRAVSQLDFHPLGGHTVYLDTTYIKSVRGAGFVNADYIISSVRQQMMSARCLLQERPEHAEIIVEARVGALGTDANEVTYGVPANNAINTAASLVPNAPAFPSIPELSLAKKSDQRGAAKLGVFAYFRETKEPVWQSGVSLSRSTAEDFWLFGAGPFQKGTVHDKPRFAGSDIALPIISSTEEVEQENLAQYQGQRFFGFGEQGQEPLRDMAEDEPAKRDTAEARLADDDGVDEDEAKEKKKSPVRVAGFQKDEDKTKEAKKPAAKPTDDSKDPADSARRKRPQPPAETSADAKK